MCFSALPWAPTARFTGISVYDLDAENKIKGQTDYWDQIDLNQGSYSRSSKGDAVQDFVNQLLGGSTRPRASALRASAAPRGLFCSKVPRRQRR